MAAAVQTRRTHKKVRTGCLTCKARRKKCDEAKPTCQRCATAGFRCDGYADITFVRTNFATNDKEKDTAETTTPLAQSTIEVLSDLSSCPSSPWQNDSPAIVAGGTGSWGTPATSVSGEDNEEIECCDTSSDLIRVDRSHQTWATPAIMKTSKMILSRNPNPLAEMHQISDLEMHCFSYVQHNTVPLFAAYFDNSAWRVDLQNAALMASHPALFKAVAALGAVHRRFCYGISREAFEYCFYAARLYDDAVKSIEHLRDLKGDQLDSEDLRVISTSQTILGIFQSFQGNQEAISAHMRSAWQTALTTPVRLIHSESFNYAKPSSPRIICTMLYQLYCRAAELFGEPALTSSLDSTFRPHRRLNLPQAYNSLIDMKNDLFKIIEEVWRHFRWIEDQWIRRVHLEPYETNIHEWTSACLRTLQSGFVIKPEQVKAFNLLNMVRCVLCLSIQGNILKTDWRTIKRIPHLPILRGPDDDDLSEAAMELCEAIDYMYAKMDADMSHVRWMFQQTLIKHEIFSFERAASTANASVSRVNEIVNLWTIATQVSETQEKVCIEALKSIIPPTAVDIDIGDLWRESRKVMVRYYEPNQGAPGYRWVSQFWTY